MAVSGLNRSWGETKPKQPIRSIYDNAATRQTADYDNIMRGYDSLASRARDNQNTSKSYIPQSPVFSGTLQGGVYSRSNDLNKQISDLQGISKTGGYSDEDISNIRERSISPIRSIYSSAQEGMKRNKVLQGGYAPNMGAVSAKMARESADRIGDITTKANASIAEMIASGRMNALNSLNPLLARENEQRNAINQRNTDLQNEVERYNTDEQRRVDEENADERSKVDEYNSRNQQQSYGNELAALHGKSNLYGTTPALTQSFGNQVLQNRQANQTANMIKNQRTNLGWARRA